MSGPRIDHSHVSSHFMEGRHDSAITQKIAMGNKSILLNTPVSRTGQVGESFFK